MEEENIYEQLFNETPQKPHSNLPLKVIVAILILVILGCAGYVVYLKINQKEKKQEETKPPVEEVYNDQETEFDCDDTCTYTMNLKDKEVKVTYQKTINEDSYHHKIQIGDQTIIDQEMDCGGPNTMKILQDVILISYHNGCDINGNHLVAYQMDGTKIFDMEYVDTLFNMRLSLTNFQVTKDKITVQTTRIYQDTLQLNKNQEVNICHKEEWVNYDVDDTTIATATYELKYQGNGLFNDPVQTKTTTLKDHYQTCLEKS